MTADTRPPLTFPTEAQASDYFRTHGEDIGRPYVIEAWRPAPAGDGPLRAALGWSSQGEWEWLP